MDNCDDVEEKGFSSRPHCIWESIRTFSSLTTFVGVNWSTWNGAIWRIWASPKSATWNAFSRPSEISFWWEKIPPLEKPPFVFYFFFFCISSHLLFCFWTKEKSPSGFYNISCYFTRLEGRLDLLAVFCFFLFNCPFSCHVLALDEKKNATLDESFSVDRLDEARVFFLKRKCRAWKDVWGENAFEALIDWLACVGVHIRGYG